MIETVLPQPASHLEATAAVVAIHHDPLIAVWFQFPDPGGHAAHRNQGGSVEFHGLPFLDFAAIEQQEIFLGGSQLLDRVDVNFNRGCRRSGIHRYAFPEGRFRRATRSRRVAKGLLSQRRPFSERHGELHGGSAA